MPTTRTRRRRYAHSEAITERTLGFFKFDGLIDTRNHPFASGRSEAQLQEFYKTRYAELNALYRARGGRKNLAWKPRDVPPNTVRE